MPTCERRPKSATRRPLSARPAHCGPSSTPGSQSPSSLSPSKPTCRGTGFTGKQNFEKQSFVPARSTANPDGPSLRHNVRALPRCSRASTLRMQRSRGFEVRTPNCEPKLSGSSGSVECAVDVASMTCNQRRTAHSSDSGHVFRLKADAVPAESGQANGQSVSMVRVRLSSGPAGEPSHLTG